MKTAAQKISNMVFLDSETFAFIRRVSLEY